MVTGESLAGGDVLHQPLQLNLRIDIRRSKVSSASFAVATTSLRSRS